MTSSSLPDPHAAPWSLARSRALLERSVRTTPGITHSMMKRPEHFAPGEFPTYLAHGHGALVEDVDGNQYIDFICGLGATSLGHAHPALVEAAVGALSGGFIQSLPTELEVTAAEALIDLVPCAEMARFFKTGADATSAAVRIARAVTGKDHILTVGYNGWHDHFMYDTPGVPAAVAALTTRLPLFQESDEAKVLEAIENGAGTVAAVLLALPYNRRVSRELVHAIREACTRANVLFVFDEIVTGFRLAMGGAHELFGVTPDLATYSKSLAAGMPLSAIVGPRRHLEVMDRLQVSTTFGGEVASLAVCARALELYRTTSYLADIQRLGRALADGVNRVSEQVGAPLRVRGYDAVPFFLFAPAPDVHAPLMRTFQGHMARRGVLLRRDLNFVCGAHTDAQVDFTIGAAEESLLAMREAGRFAGGRP
jgi:aminotransferase MxcL